MKALFGPEKAKTTGTSNPANEWPFKGEKPMCFTLVGGQPLWSHKITSAGACVHSQRDTIIGKAALKFGTSFRENFHEVTMKTMQSTHHELLLLMPLPGSLNQSTPPSVIFLP